MSRYSPTKGKNLVYVAMIAAGAFYLLRRKPAAPVNGLGWGFSSITNFARKVSKIDPGTRLVKKTVQTTGKLIDKTPAGKLIKKSPLAPLIAKVNPNRPSSAPTAKPGQQIVYQDANGRVINKWQYVAMQGEYNRKAAQAKKNAKQPIRTVHQVAPKGPTGRGQSFSDPNTSDWGSDGGTIPQEQVDATNAAYAQQYGSPATGQSFSDTQTSSGAGPDVSPSDYYDQGQDAPAQYPGLAPDSQTAAAASAEQEAMPTAADAAQPATDTPKKINPLITIGAFAAVPVILGMVGHK